MFRGFGVDDILADPDGWYQGDPKAMGAENHAEWREAVRTPRVVRAMLKDDRAGLTVDRADETADRPAGRKIERPLLVLWSGRDDLEQLFGDPLAIWRDWAPDVRGAGRVPGEHSGRVIDHALRHSSPVRCEPACGPI